MPVLYLITGSNGAGKSTVGPDYLPEHIRNEYTIFDGDKLYTAKFKELWPESVKAMKEAKKLAVEFVFETLDQLLQDALNRNDNFVYEGHFPIIKHGIYLNDLRKMAILYRCSFWGLPIPVFLKCV